MSTLLEAPVASVGNGSATRSAVDVQAQRRIAEDVPYISLWYKTNAAVFQPDIHGVRLSPIADFTFLKDVYRQAGGQ